jgi:DNA-binding NarL/FixJ family response regulator
MMSDEGNFGVMHNPEDHIPMKNAHVLIVAKEASLCGGLAALVEAIPGVDRVAQAHNPVEALKQAGMEPPDLIVLDTDVGGLDLFTALHGKCPGVKILLLVEDMRQQTQAQVAGADVALIKGYPAHELLKTVQAMLAK